MIFFTNNLLESNISVKIPHFSLIFEPYTLFQIYVFFCISFIYINNIKEFLIDGFNYLNFNYTLQNNSQCSQKQNDYKHDQKLIISLESIINFN